MSKLTRREFLFAASAATLAAAAAPLQAAPLVESHRRQRVFVGSNTHDGILAYDWDPATGELAPAGVAAKIDSAPWLTYSSSREYLFAASQVTGREGKATGGVVSFSVANGEFKEISRQNSASAGTCHIALDQTGRVLISADYSGGSAAMFLVMDGKLGPAVWDEIYVGQGPNKDRQEKAHAHFASFSPDNRFAYINDLGSDCIHIYNLSFPAPNANDVPFTKCPRPSLMRAGSYKAKPGAGPRTLHFHPNEHTAYSINELDSTVDVLEWSKAIGSLTLVSRIELLPEGYHGPTRACDTVITRDGKFVYFANRDNNFLYSFRAEFETGKLTPIARSNCGGKTPRNFVLDPTENWMLVANQDSNLISVFRRNTATGELANEGKSYPAAEPMRILF
ncbi:MAG: lactonase family protein [Terracidiphilus sp.]|jgi:6-phosphogluconolactonase